MEEGWQLTAPEGQWRDVAGEMHRLQNSFSRRVEEILGGDDGECIAAADPFLDALAFASGIRVSARAAAGDQAAARQAAYDGAILLDRHGQRVRLSDAALAAVRASKVTPATAAWAETLSRSIEAAKPLITAMRGREAAAESTAATLDELDRRGIASREWMEAARSEGEEPFIFLASVNG